MKLLLIAALALGTISAVGQSAIAPSAAAPSSPAHSAAACPWLAIGTASHLLGVPAVVQVQSKEDGSGSCIFQPTESKAETRPTTRSEAGAQLLLHVSATAEKPCSGHAKPLSGIGNEAEECRGRAQPITITGRVRNRWFTLEGMNLPSESVHHPAARWAVDPASEPSAPTLLEAAAEQVAGNLY